MARVCGPSFCWDLFFMGKSVLLVGKQKQPPIWQRARLLHRYLSTDTSPWYQPNMKCGSCGADLYTGMQACPRCGAFVDTSRGESQRSIIGPVLIAFVIAIVFIMAVAATAVRLIRAPIAATPVYREAIEIARSSPEVQNLLGEPIQEGWPAFGEVRRIYGSDLAEWPATVKG